VVCLMTLSVTQAIYLLMAEWLLMKAELKGMWIEVVAAYFKALFQHSPIEAEENQEMPLRIVGVPAEIRTWNLQDTSQKLFSLSLLFRLLVLHTTFTVHKNWI
jgi:hypothetical protein